MPYELKKKDSLETKNMTNDEKTPKNLKNDINQKFDMKMDEPKAIEKIEEHLVIRDENAH
jgi:hypothetical protein